MAAERAGPVDGYLPIGAYGLIGDCHTAALVSDDGGIDWYCPGRFDAPAVFCRLLDAGRGGTLRLGPTGPYTVQRAYRASTAVLETTFTTRAGQVRLTDFMSVEPCPDEAYGYDVRARRRLIRLVEALSGEPEFALRFRPTFDYARVETRLWPVAERGAIAQGDRRYLVLSCPGSTWNPLMMADCRHDSVPGRDGASGSSCRTLTTSQPRCGRWIGPMVPPSST